MDTFVPHETLAEDAKLATIPKVALALTLSACRLLIPWILIGVIFVLAPGVFEIPTVTASVIAVAALCFIILLATDINNLKTRGYTQVLMMLKLRVVDPTLDNVLWQARFTPKSLLKCICGEYEIIDISATGENGKEGRAA